MNQKFKVCRYWIELDNDMGHLYEFCKIVRKKCTCSGVKSQCNYPKYFKEINDNKRNKIR